MLASVLVLTFCAVLVASAFGVLWKQRQSADELAAKNAAEAAKNAEAAAAVDALHSVAHDLDNIFGTLIGNASTAHDMTGEELAEVFAAVEEASRNGRRMIRALRGATGAPSEHSLGTTLRVITNMHRRTGTKVDLQIDSDLKFIGQPDQAFRIIYNLMGNAAREIEGMENASVRAHLTSSELRITNPLRPGATINERVFERGFSTHGSSGLGLQIVRDVAKEIDLHVSYEIDNGAVSFIVSTEAKSGKRTKSSSRPATRAAGH